MEQRLTIVGLGVTDLEVSNKFYKEKFGWKLMDSSNESISFFQLNGILLSLYPRVKLAEDAQVSDKGSGFRGVTLAYNTRSKEEVDSLFKDFESKDVKIIKQPEEVFWGGYSGYIADPDDHLWEIAFNPFLPLDGQGNSIEAT